MLFVSLGTSEGYLERTIRVALMREASSGFILSIFCV